MPEINGFTKLCNIYLPTVEPHYGIFINNIRRGGLKNLKEFINVFLYEQIKSINYKKIDAIKTDDIPIGENFIQQLTQRLMIEAPLSPSKSWERKFSAIVKKAGDPSEEEKTAYIIVVELIGRLFVRKLLVPSPDIIMVSFVKEFVRVYSEEFDLLVGSNSIPKDTLKHLNAIPSPDWNAVMKEAVANQKAKHKTQLNAKCFIWNKTEEKVDELFKAIADRAVTDTISNFIENDINKFKSLFTINSEQIRTGFEKIKWIKSPLNNREIAFLFNELCKSEIINKSQARQINQIISNRFSDSKGKSISKSTLKKTYSAFKSSGQNPQWAKDILAIISALKTK